MSFVGQGEEKRKQIAYVLSQCEDYTERLSEWERNFVESVTEQFERRGSLSEKQEDVLEKIYCKLP